MSNYLFVMLGGAVGALMRYGVSKAFAGLSFLSMPLGTLSVNIAGCFILGLLTGFATSHSEANRGIMLMLTTGMCGAFTTFSTFSGESVKLMENGQYLATALYLCASILIGFFLFWFGKSMF